MKKNVILLVLIALVAGCDSQAASNANIKRGLNHYLARLQPCLSYTATQFLLTVPASTPQAASLDVLTSVGLLTKQVVGMGDAGQPQVQYSLTGKGRDSGVPDLNAIGRNQPRLFCFVRIQVNRIVNFTEPVANEGVLQLDATYTRKLVDTPSWADNPLVQKTFPDMTPAVFAQEGLQSSSMAQTNSGWRVADDM